MKVVEFKKYRSLEDYQFDVGFDLKDEDFKGMTNEKRNQLFSENIYFIKNVKGRLVIFNGHNNFFVTISNNDFTLKDGHYIIDEDRYGGDNNLFKHTIIEKDDYGEELYELILDIERGEKILEEMKEYDDEQRTALREKGLNVWFSSDYMVDNWKEKFKNKLKDVIEKEIKDEHKKGVDETIQDKVKDDEERKQKENETDIIENNIKNGLAFEIISDSAKINYDVKENILTYRDKDTDTPQLRLRFKSYDYFKIKLGDKLYALKRLYSVNSVKEYLSNEEISFKLESYKDDGLGNGQFQPMVELDFENGTFNGFKVAKGKIKFLMNRTTDESFNPKYRDKNVIELLNRLSGIRVDILNTDKILVGSYEFYIKFSLHDRETFNVTFMGIDKLVSWNTIKEHLTRGSSVDRYISKSDFLKFCKELEIPIETIEQQIKKTKILYKLKGEKNK